MGSRGTYVATAFTLFFTFVMGFLLNEESAYCLLPESFTTHWRFTPFYVADSGNIRCTLSAFFIDATGMAICRRTQPARCPHPNILLHETGTKPYRGRRP